MNFSTIEPDGQGTGRGLILSAIYLANPGGVPQCDLRGEREGVGGGGCGTLWARLGWLTHRQISSGSGPICPEQVCFKPATGVCLCVCSCLRVCEDRVREQEKTGNRFPWLARCWPRSYLDTLTFCFCLAVQSEHGGLFTHIYLCHATPGQVSAMQWLPLLSSAASVQHPESTQTDWNAHT